MAGPRERRAERRTDPSGSEHPDRQPCRAMICVHEVPSFAVVGPSSPVDQRNGRGSGSGGAAPPETPAGAGSVPQRPGARVPTQATSSADRRQDRARWGNGPGTDRRRQ
ncbi:hypothetical protein GCM10010466_11920 [Planomonospora alba]|uniref:Uncharacterized protein n=1 Tax=Planomonospora alba TaxID=161354 RepID=A0ABP6MQP1_9ACTN